MTKQTTAINFLEPNYAIKMYKWFNIFVLLTLIFNMSMVGVFFVVEPIQAVALDECRQNGFDSLVSKWEWNEEQGAYIVEGGANGTNVTGDSQSASWTANPLVAGVLRKAATVFTPFPGGTSGTVTASDHAISHLTFCGDCSLELTKTDVQDPVMAGGELVYTLTLTNTGTANCTGGGVKVKDIFDPNTTYVSAEPSPQTVNSDNLIWNFGTVEPGESHNITLIMEVKEDTECCETLVNTAKYWSDQTGWGDQVTEDTSLECPVTECGNSDEEEGEECDDGDANGLVCEAGYGEICTYCSEVCTKIEITGPYCGDGVENGDNEQCDDGNNENGDGCDELCQIEEVCGECGDGTLDSGEECDDGNKEDGDGCSANCTIEIEPICGDGIVNQPSEECDGTDRVTEGKYCTSDCTLEDIPEDRGSLQVCKIVDLDGDLETEDDQTMSQGWNITLSQNQQDLTTQATEECGCTTFHNLIPGEYFVQEELTDNWIAIDPVDGGITAEVAAQNTTQVFLYNQPVGSIQICKYEDVDGDGELDVGEEDNLLSGWTFYLVGHGEYTTEECGCTTIEDLPLGTYEIEEVGQKGWTMTYPEISHEVTISLDNPNNIVNFLNKQDEEGLTITGCKYNEKEEKLGNWEIILEECTSTVPDCIEEPCETEPLISCSQVDSTMTETNTEADNFGCYAFNIKQDGIYRIKETNKDHWTQLSPIEPVYYELSVVEGSVVSEPMSYDFMNRLEKYCGDGECNGEETCSTCSSDCGGCGGGGPVCGDGTCNANENSDSCCQDCGGCGGGPVCGDGECNGEETCSTCSSDCGGCGGGTNCLILGTCGGPTFVPEEKEEVVVLGEIGEPELTIMKNVGRDYANPGDKDIKYKITITNIGNLEAVNVIVKDNLPEGLVIHEENIMSKTWNIGNISPGEIKEIIYAVDVSPDAQPKTYINTAEANADNYKRITDTAALEIREIKVLPASGFSLVEFITVLMSVLLLFGSSAALNRKYLVA